MEQKAQRRQGGGRGWFFFLRNFLYMLWNTWAVLDIILLPLRAQSQPSSQLCAVQLPLWKDETPCPCSLGTLSVGTWVRGSPQTVYSEVISCDHKVSRCGWPIGQSSIIGHMETNEGDTESNIGKCGTILSGKRDRKLNNRILGSFRLLRGNPY